MKRTAIMLSTLSLLVLALVSPPAFSNDKAPAKACPMAAQAACCPEDCTCCTGGACTCTDAACKCCKADKCKPKKCEKACTKA
jgi:hypothetical protein